MNTNIKTISLLSVVLACAACGQSYGSQPADDPFATNDDPRNNTSNGGANNNNAGALPIPSGNTDPATGTPTTTTSGNDGTNVIKCDPSKPFTSVDDVPGFAYPEGNYGPPHMSPDELTLYMAMQTAAGGNVAVYAASRTSRTQAFGPALPLAGFAPGGQNSYQLSPNLSADGLALVFEGMPGTAQQTTSIFVATRPSIASPFGVPSALALTSTDPQGPYVLPTGNAVYFSDGHIQRATLPSQTTVGDVKAVSELNNAANGLTGERFPVVRGDELAIYWQASNNNGSVGSWDLYAATRTSVNQPFGALHAVSEVNTTGDEYASALSPDGCRLYLITFDPAGPTVRLRVATLAP